MPRRRKGEAISGWAVIDKPEGPTSTDVVNKVRRGLNAQKAGHAGTLDPLASGLLIVALGEATKTISYVMDAQKTYRFTARWGVSRSTDDREGPITQEAPGRPNAGAIEAALPAFTGPIQQVPPAFSAIKVDGERAYDLARAGEDVVLEPREVQVHSLSLVDCPDADHAVLEMVCGKGTYVRSLVRDLAKALGTCGHVYEIRRTAVGPFHIDTAIPLDQWQDLVHKGSALEHLAPVETALDDIPALAVTDMDASRLRNGQPVLLRDDAVLGQVKAISKQTDETGARVEPAVLCSLKGRPVAICRFHRGELKPARVFNLPA